MPTNTYRSIGMLALLIGIFLASGCGYGEVSPKTYEIAKSLYNISNRKLVNKLDVVKEKIDEALSSEEISPRESQWLYAIVERAEHDEWKQAMKSARRIMEDQVSK